VLRKIYAILLATVVTASAEISFGVDLGYNQQSTESETRINMSFAPFVGIHPTDIIEIDPSFAWNLYSYSSDNNNSSYSVNSIEPGCGLYFHLLKNNVLGFALGPKVSYKFAFAPNYDDNSPQHEFDKYFNGTLNIACQMAIDLMFSKNFTCRLSSSLFKYSLNSWNIETEDGNKSEGTYNEFDLRSVVQPYFGFLFTF
jgi:hypothetical protein